MIGAVDLNSLDKGALHISLYSLLIIFVVIISLVAFFSIFTRVRSYLKNPNSQSTNGNGKTRNSNIPAGDSAAIAAAIYLFLDEIHDNENRVVTIKRVSRNYSPWNSKIYGINWIKNR